MTGPHTAKHLATLRTLTADGVTAIAAQSRAMGVSGGYIRHLRHLLKRDDEREATEIIEAAEDWEIFNECCPEDGDPPPFVCVPDWYGRP